MRSAGQTDEGRERVDLDERGQTHRRRGELEARLHEVPDHAGDRFIGPSGTWAVYGGAERAERSGHGLIGIAPPQDRLSRHWHVDRDDVDGRASERGRRSEQLRYVRNAARWTTPLYGLALRQSDEAGVGRRDRNDLSANFVYVEQRQCTRSAFGPRCVNAENESHRALPSVTGGCIGQFALAFRERLRYSMLVEARKPQHPDAFAVAFLERLQERPEAEQFVLGGGFALKHYLDYRDTADIDAWWRSAPDDEALNAAQEAFADAAARFGYSMRRRESGRTTSIEALDGNRKVFSFQVAVRDVALDQPVASPWGRFPIETADDNVGAKMNALVNRGAPRDFRDIREIVRAGIASAERCWELWAAKNPGRDLGEARREVQRLLAGIEARRPLERLPAGERQAAAERRAWFRDVFAAEPPLPSAGK